MSCFVRFKCGFKILQPYFSPHGLKVGRLLMKLLPASHILVYLGEGRWHGVMQKVPNWVVVKHFWANWWWNLPRSSWPRHVDEKRLGTRVETMVGDKNRWQDGGRLESSFWTLWMTCFQSSHCHESWFILVSVACCSCCSWVCCFGFSFYFFGCFTGCFFGSEWLYMWSRWTHILHDLLTSRGPSYFQMLQDLAPKLSCSGWVMPPIMDDESIRCRIELVTLEKKTQNSTQWLPRRKGRKGKCRQKEPMFKSKWVSTCD